MDISTRYLGLDLPHPFVAGASPMVDHLDMVRELEDAGASAIVMHSLFEEQITQHLAGVEAYVYSHEESFAEARTYLPRTHDFVLGPDQYLAQIGKLKAMVSVPVIASLNGVTQGAWLSYAKMMQDAGADALELNIYRVPTDLTEGAVEIEERLVKIVEEVHGAVSIPVAVKLGPFYTSLPHLAKRLERVGAQGLVLFNRFYQPDIDIENLEIKPRLRLSDSSELSLRLRWLSMLHGRINMDLSVSGGIHTVEDAVKAVMAGACSIQMVSALLERGPSYLADVRKGFEAWLEEYEYESLRQMRGSMSYLNTPDPEAVERANYLKILQSWKP